MRFFREVVVGLESGETESRSVGSPLFKAGLKGVQVLLVWALCSYVLGVGVQVRRVLGLSMKVSGG